MKLLQEIQRIRLIRIRRMPPEKYSKPEIINELKF